MVSEFRGPPPHDLGTVEIAVAQAMNENTEITLHIIDDCTVQLPKSFGYEWRLQWHAHSQMI